ncbi:hypothetical protein [Flavobacterium columnare]|uniref:hypothetical protein n=1 Tax=Flavobacterium columnare TaxID=996 RepID=UPI000D1AE02C|nr:hypothetical protein [Flavobacterium columnare]MBF6656304.1 hypothetical protein [Flavobacterium columnare]MBF6659334.1 hypothetical protein [Flavobacterium columnare]PTD16583.1 hypothetical protein C6N29_02960 [Flavobacterium columnare]
MKKTSNKTEIKEIPIEWTNSGRLKLFFIFLFLIVSFFFLFNYLLDSRKDEIQLIKSDYKLSRGIITRIQLYKGDIVTVKFKVDKRIYEGGDGLDQIKNKEVGDSIDIMYFKKDPNLFITELNSEWQK